MKTILISDGDGLLVRSHYAVGHEIMTDNNLEVGGVNKSIQKLREQIVNWNVDALYVAFDSPGGTTFRHRAYVDYKANRPPKPEGLIHSKKLFMEILPHMGAAIEMNPEYEADDLCGSMTKRAVKEGWRVVMSSHDKDMLELMQFDNVFIAPPFDPEIFTMQKLQEKFGVQPNQIQDYLALLGDSADFIPGVDQCGPKRASKLLSDYGTLENVLEAAKRGDIKNKLGEYLRLQGVRTLAFRDMLRLRLDVETRSVESCAIGNPNYNELLKLFKSNNLESLYLEALADSQN